MYLVKGYAWPQSGEFVFTVSLLVTQISGDTLINLIDLRSCLMLNDINNSYHCQIHYQEGSIRIW